MKATMLQRYLQLQKLNVEKKILEHKKELRNLEFRLQRINNAINNP